MNLENRLRLSYYQKTADIDASHGVEMVRHSETGKFFVKKTLTRYNTAVYEYIRDTKPEGIPCIQELIEDEGVLYVIEDYISGNTLRDMMEEHKTFPESYTIRFIISLCNILSPLHNHVPPIVNRDLKPENIIISTSGKLFILDFDIAREVNPDKSCDTEFLGSRGYAAPEQFGFGASAPTADIYALGVIMNEMLTGKLPAEERYSGRLSEIIKQCTEIDPKNRYSGSDELIAALKGTGGNANQGSLQKNKKVLPGFRSDSLIRKAAALLWYIFIIYFSVTFEAPEGNPINPLLFKINWFLMLSGWTFIAGNYRGILDVLPLSSSRHKYIRYPAIYLYCVLYSAVLIAITTTVYTLFIS